MTTNTLRQTNNVKPHRLHSAPARNTEQHPSTKKLPMIFCVASVSKTKYTSLDTLCESGLGVPRPLPSQPVARKRYTAEHIVLFGLRVMSVAKGLRKCHPQVVDHTKLLRGISWGMSIVTCWRTSTESSTKLPRPAADAALEDVPL